MVPGSPIVSLSVGTGAIPCQRCPAIPVAPTQGGVCVCAVKDRGREAPLGRVVPMWEL